MSAKRLLGFVSTVALLSGCQSWQKTDFDAMPPTASLPPSSQDGRVQVRYWDNISGVKLSTLTALPTFPDNPDTVEELTELRGPINRADYYGTLVRGFIIPPTTGRYRFFVSADDAAQFWLSDSDTTGNKELIASAPAWTGLEQYTKYTSQTSPWQDLTAGNRYYFEIVHKEGTRGDHFAVAWEGPGIAQQIVSGDFLASFGRPLYPDSEELRNAYGLGYRIGYFDSSEEMDFNPQYPPLDEDQDGIYDNWEITYGLASSDPTDATSDRDDDLLTAYDEFRSGTDPTNPDTSGDGLTDGEKFAYGLDPLDPEDLFVYIEGVGTVNLLEYLREPDAEAEMVSGFVGQYFTGRNFNQFKLIRQDQEIDFDWGGRPPMEGMPQDNFSIRWSGIFTPPHSSGTQDYQFRTVTDDGVRLYLNGVLVIDAWINQGPTAYSHVLALEAQESIPVTMEYYEAGLGAVARLTITDIESSEEVSTAANVRTPDPTNSSTQDTDGDGIPDTWKLAHGLNPWVGVADNVSNDSGVTNLEAYQSGLDPWTLEPTSTQSAPPTIPETQPQPEPSLGKVTLYWTAPLTRVDGSSISLSEIRSYTIRYGQNPNDLNFRAEAGSDQTTIELPDLEPGTWFFSISVTDTNGQESAPSDVVEHIIK